MAVQPARPSRRWAMMPEQIGWWRSLVLLLLFLLLWQTVTTVGHVNPLLLPSAYVVLRTFIADIGIGGNGQLWLYAWETVKVLLEAFLITILCAVVLTTLALTGRWGRALLSTVSGIFQPLPSIALLPLAILWFGLNSNSVLFVVVMAMLFPLSSALTVGFATASETLIRVGRNYELRGPQLALRIYLPLALPNAISGLELAWSYGWRAIVGAELIFGVTGSGAGLGYFINNARIYGQTAEALAAIVMIIFLGLVAQMLFVISTRLTTKKWGMSR